MLELLEKVLNITSCVAVFGILYVEIDDVYGVTNLRKISQRRIRKFLRTSTRYFRKRFKESE